MVSVFFFIANISSTQQGKKMPPSPGSVSKTSNRIFKVKGSMKNRKKGKAKAGKAKENDLSWLEMDAVYGFFE